ncbi:MAG: acriflavin resistance protein [Bdellovibrio sp. ArHS]|uniref:efflux RND transporter permease subunit n=1 Tax=Bdellovibrio sp. ArHS TaxID=1569284 RepID=UPI0005825146|nr:efflux RND transporter permease subunit [Bdellovibrio sp. ArHS]KHD87792.1 MAG: acriflavin resistance protein [Bdellovibrio sp. ArHS]
MTLSDLSIRRPVFAWMLMFGLIVFGAISFMRMGVSELPDVDFPVISLSVRYEGAAPEVMEADVIDPIEDALISIQGVKNITSIARNSTADVTIEFDLEVNIDVAFQDVQAKMAQIQGALPQAMDPPTVMKINPEDFPIMWLSVSSNDMPLQDMMVYVNDQIRDRLTTVPGVGNLWMPGYLEPNLRVWIRNEDLHKYALSVSDVVSTLRNEHAEPPAGRAEYNKTEYSLRTLGEAKKIDQFNKILINSRGGGPNYSPIPLERVADFKEGTVDVVQFARANGKFAVGLGVVKQRGSNAVSVAHAVKDRIDEIQKTLPEGMQIVVNYDGTKFVEESVHELVLTLILAAILTSLVCWLFLGSWSSTFNVLLAIPTSVLGSFIILYFAGFTLNIFTLMGLSLAIGIVVDDAIMVLENIIRHLEMGKKKKKAALVGAREITFAAMAASVSLVAIFLPIAFMEGLIGRFLFQFGVTMSAAVMISLLEALTLTPMRASQFVESGERTTRIGRGFESGFQRLHDLYTRSLKVSLNHRWKVIGASLVFFVVSFGSVAFLKGEFQPAQDQSSLMIQISNPPKSAISFTDEKVKIIEDFLHKRSEVKSTFVAAGGFTGGEANNAIIFVDLKPKGDRGKDAEKGKELSQQQFIEVVRDYLNKTIPDAKPQVQDPSTQGFGGGGGKGFPVEFSIQGPNWNELGKYSETIVEELKNKKIMTDVSSDYQAGAPEIQVIPNRQKASDRGVSVIAIGEVLNAMMGGVVAGSYEKGGHRYDIRVKMADNGQAPHERIRQLKVRNNRGELVPIADVVDIKEASVASTISRKNRQRSIIIYGNMGPGLSQQQASDQAMEAARKILPADYKVIISGSAEEFQQSFISLIFALVLGFVVAYMVLASQFNSFIDPITVFMALPFSFSGAFLALLVGGQSLNIFSMIGLILLMGIVKKNSILLVDFTNQRRDIEKVPVTQALIEACPTRLRPILMTSFATIAGAVPAALSLGPGAEARQPMAIAVIGGVLVSTFLTLYVVPCVYSLFARWDRRERHSDEIEA